MNNKATKLAIASTTLLFSAIANAATTWSAQDYDVSSGDFNGDGKSDILYIAKGAGQPSGIALSDGVAPNIALQSWPSNYLGIQWYGGLYSAIVADFNYDGKSDVLLQRASAGDSYLLLADTTGRLTGITQTLASTALGVSWTRDQHVILPGDFNGDGRADLYFQPTSVLGTSAVVYAATNGLFTSGPAQSWTDSSWTAFKWSTKSSNIFVNDFSADGRADLLVQPKPTIVMIDYDVAIPVPTYKPGAFGIAFSPFNSNQYQLWDRRRGGVDWSSIGSNLIVGDFNGDGRADVIVQPKSATGTARVVWGSASTNRLNLDQPVALTFGAAGNGSAASYRIISMSATGATGVYLQATTPTGTDYIVTTIPIGGGDAVVIPVSHEIETVAYAYDAKGRLSRVVHSGTVNSYLQTQYSYDKANNRKVMVTTGSSNNAPP
jgi:hypothetical protein